MKKLKYIVIIFIVSLITSCMSLNYYSDKNNPIVAEVDGQKLYLKDLEKLYTNDNYMVDSVYVAKEFINSWVKGVLKKNDAKKLFSDYQDDIEVLVEKYRNSLLTYKYEDHYSSYVDTVVLEREILDYYTNNKSQFKLISPIVKAKILILPVDYKKEKTISSKFYSSKSDDYQDLLTLSERDGLFLYEFSEEWVYFSEFVKYIPFSKKSLDEYLSTTKKDRIVDSKNIYLISILEYEKSNSDMPIQFVRNSIIKSLINNRRRTYFKKIEDSIYNRALIDRTAFVIDIDNELLNKLKTTK